MVFRRGVRDGVRSVKTSSYIARGRVDKCGGWVVDNLME